MTVSTDLSALKRANWSEYVVRFLFGGAASLLAMILAKRFGPAVGGLFLAFPAIFPASATLVEKHEKEKKTQKGMHGEERGRDAAALDAAGASMGSVGLLLFALIVWLLLPEHSAWLVLVAGGAVWFVSSWCLWFLREHRHSIFGFTPRREHAARASRP